MTPVAIQTHPLVVTFIHCCHYGHGECSHYYTCMCQCSASVAAGDWPADICNTSVALEATKTHQTWFFIQHMFGPHSVHKFSLDSNAMIGSNGKRLRHFTPYPTPNSGGIDAFAQPLSSGETYFAIPDIHAHSCGGPFHSSGTQ